MNLLNQSPMFTTNDQGTFEIRIDVTSIRESGYINFSGLAWSDQKYKVFGSIQKVFSGFPVVTDTDLIAHDRYIKELDRSLPIILVINEAPSKFSISDKEVYGASKKRLERAQEKLHEEGFTCVYLVTKKQAELTIMKAREGRLEHRALNVVSLASRRAV